MRSEIERQKIEEEYKIWRKNVPHLYDMLYSTTLKHSTPFIQWFPHAQRVDNVKTVQRLLMTTFSGGAEKENLLFAQVSFPDTIDEDSLNNADIEFKITQSIPLPIDANKCRYSPHVPNLIACRTASEDVLIYDFTKHASFDSTKEPDIVLKGHTEGGFSIDWNPNVFGQLATGGRDCLVNLFDVNNGLLHSKRIHDGIVNDISFSNFEPHTFCSVADDLRVAINDTRSTENILVLEKAHTSSIECCSFSPFRSELLVTGSSDGVLKVWDIRSLGAPLFVLRGHGDSVINCKWSPHYESLLASCSKDRRVIIWDLNKTDITESESSPEMLFVHGGHTDMVDDLDWNPAEPMEIASVSCDALLEIWKVPLEEYIN